MRMRTVELSNIRHNGERKLVLGDVDVGTLDFVGLLLRANCCHDRVTAREKGVKNMGSNEAASTCN